MLKAVIFDMDGVIIDSEPMHAKAAILALEKYHVSISMDYIQEFIGSTTKHMCDKMVRDFQLDITPEELLKANEEMKAYLLKKKGHTVIPYVIDLIRDLHNNGIKLSIASSSPASDIEDVMDSLNIRQYFDCYVSGSMVAQPKPAPDIFLLAADRLGVDPSECIVIEDSFHGITAANAAGMACIGYINPNSGKQDLRKASFLVEGFDEIDYAYLNKIYQYAHNEPVTILTTEHFIIREMTVQDIEELFQICQDPDIKRYLDGFTNDLETEKEKHLAYIKNVYHFYCFGLWGVYYKGSGLLAGRCGIEYKLLDNEEIYEIGWLLAKPYQGHGYAREFVSQVMNYCFQKLNISCITAVIDRDNIKSVHLAEQIGMKRYGECIRNGRSCYKYRITYPA